MPWIEIFRLAFTAVGANKLRSGLTIVGITIGTFSIICVVTATSALRSSIESGLSYLGSNFFQFSKYPVVKNRGPQAASRYGNRRDLTFEQGTLYKRLMADTGAAICLKVYTGGRRVTYGRLRTNPNITAVGTNENYLIANSYTLAEGRNLTETDVEFARQVTVIGSDIRKRLFPAEDPVGKTIRVNRGNFRVIGVLGEKGAGLDGVLHFMG